MSASAPLSIASSPLFAGLGAGELGRFARVCRQVAYVEGDAIVRQGHPADGAFILACGAAEVVTALPGGGEAVVARLGPGSVLGEMALLDRGIRSASVLARSAVSGFFIDRASFRLLLAEREPAAFAVRDRITHTLCRRLRELNAKITSAENVRRTQAAPPMRTKRAARPADFDWRSFLPVLPLFEGFDAAERDALIVRFRCLRLARGAPLFEQGEPGTAAYIVVRGALEISHVHAGHAQRIGILGPGRLCGILALIEQTARSMSARAREPSTLLEIPRARFTSLMNANNAVGAKFQDAIHRELLQSLARTNNTLTRLLSQARIRGAARAAQALQREIAALDVRAP